MVLRDENGSILPTANASTITLFRAQEVAMKKLRQMKAINNRCSILSVSSDDSSKNCNNSAQVSQMSHDLHVSVENFVVRVGEDTDLLFSLYDGVNMVPITENFIVRWSKNGLVKDVNLLNSIKVIFKVNLILIFVSVLSFN